jgi:glycosyltransferase involved in cell wall biosynthesis
MNQNVPALCLNMIVKNESKIIERLLNSVVKYIDSYCICDTGSTDNTVEVIETFFEKHGIPGKVIREPFRDFGYNRTFALKACEDMEKAEYVLLLDADMIFWVDPQITPDTFKKLLPAYEAFTVFQGSDRYYYKNTRIVKNRIGVKYWGVTHEYVDLPREARSYCIDKHIAFINDIGDGGSKTDKFLRDVRLLKKGLQEHPDNDRYTFYLANSLKDAGILDEAIETYRKRIQIGGWIEEIWYSHFNIGHCYARKNDMTNAISAWLDAFECYPARIENIYEIIHHYRITGKNKLAYQFCVIAKRIIESQQKFDFLFMQKDVYDFKIDYELSIVGYYYVVGYYYNMEKYDLAKISMNILNYPHLEKDIAANVMSNYKFYVKPLSRKKTSTFDDLITQLKRVGVEKMETESDFVSSTPSIVRLSNKRYIVNVRFVNYSINEEGEYVQKSNIETRNVVATLERDGPEDACRILASLESYGSYRNEVCRIIANLQREGPSYPWRIVNECFVEHDKQYDAYYVGLEDMRLIFPQKSGQEILIYSANRGLPDGRMSVELGALDPATGRTIPPLFPTTEHNHKIEKNWVWIPHGNGHKLIYHWYPVTVGDEVDGKFVKTHDVATPPCFRNLRGSTNGIVIEGDIWLICHAVSYEDRRYYYHMFVVLDGSTLQVKKYTPFFTFDNEKVEYTLGFTWDPLTDELLIGYSLMDRRTEYMSVARKSIEFLPNDQNI